MKASKTGIMIVGIVGFLISGLHNLLISGFMLYVFATRFTAEQMHNLPSWSIVSTWVKLAIAFGIMVSAANIIKLKEWARKVFITLLVFDYIERTSVTILSPYTTGSRVIGPVLMLVYCSLLIYFFTRPNIKKQFIYQTAQYK